MAPSSTLTTVQQFNDAFNRHDVEGVMALMTEDCVFENTFPPPDGVRLEGQSAVRTFFSELFESSSRADFEWEETVACGERAFVRWLYRWVDADGRSGHVRGVDIMRVHAGKVAEKLSYVKG